MIGSLDSLNSDCRSFSNLTDREQVSLSEPSLNQALDLRSVQLFWIACQLLIENQDRGSRIEDRG